MASEIRSACQNPAVSEFVVCFDLSVSALGLGEALYSTMLARYAMLHKKQIRFVFIGGQLRSDFAEIYSDTNSFFGQFEALKSIVTALLDAKCSTVQYMSWNDFQKSILSNSFEGNTPYIAMDEQVRRRESTYNHSFNILNWLISYEDADFVNGFLLNYEELSACTGVFRPDFDYITVAARYSALWRESGNLSYEALASICKYLFAKYPNHKIMIVSDEAGCNHYREFSDINKFGLLFSKDYSQTYLGDGALILGSVFFFQFMGGGIGAIPMFSNHSYEITCPLANEIMWSPRKLLSWQCQSQHFTASNDLSLPTIQ